MAKKGKGLGGTSGLNPPGMMDPALGPGQDGFNVRDRVTTYQENDCSSPYVGRDDADAVDSRGKGGSPSVEPSSPKDKG